MPDQHKIRQVEFPAVENSCEQPLPQSPKLAADPVQERTAEELEDAWLASITLRQDYTETVGVEKVLLVVPFRKPNKDEFFRVHSAPTHQRDVTLVEFKTERELYVVTEAVEPALAELSIPARLFLCVNRQGTAFIWPAKLPVGDRRADAWRTSGLETAKLAQKNWVRVHADLNLGGYQPFQAQADLGEPKWPALSFAAILKLALKDRIVDSLDHDAVKHHLGQA